MDALSGAIKDAYNADNTPTVYIAVISNYVTKADKEKRVKLESILGSYLFKFWSNYDDIVELI